MQLMCHETRTNEGVLRCPVTRLLGHLTLRRDSRRCKLSLYSGHDIKLHAGASEYGEVTNAYRFRVVSNDARNCLLVLSRTLSGMESEIKRKVGQAYA